MPSDSACRTFFSEGCAKASLCAHLQRRRAKARRPALRAASLYRATGDISVYLHEHWIFRDVACTSATVFTGTPYSLIHSMIEPHTEGHSPGQRAINFGFRRV